MCRKQGEISLAKKKRKKKRKQGEILAKKKNKVRFGIRSYIN